METARLGRDGPVISRLGMGGWQAGGTGVWGAGPAADEDDAIAAIRAGVDRGVTWVDTAASYGLGRSEEVVARALAPWRVGEEVLVFTKCGHPWEPPDRIRTDLSPGSIRRECEESLRRLGVDRVDLYQFHHPDPAVPVEESWGALGELVDEGKVRWAGVSNFGVDLLERCEAIRHVDSVQPELHLLRRNAMAGVIPWCRSHGTGVLVYSPLASGVLSGAWDAGRFARATEDERASLPPAVLASFVDRLRPVAASAGLGAGGLAVAWTLAVPGVTAAICGARRPAQVEAWIGAGDVILRAESLDAIGALLEAEGIGGGG